MNRPTLRSSLHTCWTAKGESCKHISPLLPTHLQRLALCCSLPPEVRVLRRARDAYFLNTFLSLTRRHFSPPSPSHILDMLAKSSSPHMERKKLVKCKKRLLALVQEVVAKLEVSDMLYGMPDLPAYCFLKKYSRATDAVHTDGPPIIAGSVALPPSPSRELGCNCKLPQFMLTCRAISTHCLQL